MTPAFVILIGILLVILALLSGIVSALETALFSIKEHHIAVVAESKPHLTGMMRAIARQPRRSLHQVLLLGTVLNFSLAILGLLLLREIGNPIAGRPFLSAVAVFGTLILVSEVIPTLAALAAPAQVFGALVTPFIRVSDPLEKVSQKLESITDQISQHFFPVNLQPKNHLSDDELETLVEMREEEGVLAKSESEMIQGIIRLGNKTAKDCMTPRVDTLLIEDTSGPEEILETLRSAEKWHWFVPVFQGSPDVVVGVLDVTSWLYHAEADLSDFIIPPVFVPETMNALEAFRDYLNRPRSLAVVLDEYGGVEGVLTHSDIIEEILEDAAPPADREEAIEVISPWHLRADGDARLDEIGDLLGIDLEHEGLDTIGGLVFNELGHVPRPGTQVQIEDNLRVTVRRSQRQRITAVEIELTALDDEDSRKKRKT